MKNYLVVYQYNAATLGMIIQAHVVVEADDARDAAHKLSDTDRSQEVLSVTYMP